MYLYFQLLQNNATANYGSRIITVPAVISPLFLILPYNWNVLHYTPLQLTIVVGSQKRHTHSS